MITANARTTANLNPRLSGAVPSVPPHGNKPKSADYGAPPGRRTVNTEPGPPKSSILPELCRTHLGLPDARAEFEPGIFVLLQCGALRSLALPGMQSREHDPKRLQGPRCEMQHKRQRHFAFVLRRWLTWFYPQVCQNLALRERQSFCFVPLHLSLRPPEISDTT